MYIEHLVPKYLAILSSPRCFIARLRYPKLVSFGLMANLNFLSKKGIFHDVDCIVDVGANIGQFAFMAHTVMPSLPIYSFEPDSTCFKELKQTFADHEIRGECYPVALSDKQGSVNLNVYESSANNSTLLRENESALQVNKVDCSTLDILDKQLEAFKCLYLKIDVQGAEISVLRGASQFLKRCKFVQLEVSLVNAYIGNAHIADIMSVMRSEGFSCWEIVDVLRKRKSDNLGILEMDMLFIEDKFLDEN
jgi:FkbM family methyltransferase